MLVEKITTKEGYQDYIKGDYSGVYYSTEECGVCQVLKPQVVTIFEELKMPIKEISLNDLRELAAQQLILKSPTLIIYENAREILRMSGFMDLNRLKLQLERMLS